MEVVAVTTRPAPAATEMILTQVITLKGHEDYVKSISYFPDGKQRINACVNNAVRRWNLQAGKEIEKARRVCEYQVKAVAVSGGSQWIVTAGRDNDHAYPTLPDIYPESHPIRQRKVAVKSMRIDIAGDDSKDRITQMLLHEYRARKQLQHENLLPLLGLSYEFGPLPAMVSPWMQNGSLTTYLAKNFAKLTIERKLQILQQVATAISYRVWHLHLLAQSLSHSIAVHSNDIVHGDLTA
ncbi:hypothetical protein AZE42_09029, partial [Rhizopogon vesiculosus]